MSTDAGWGPDFKRINQVPGKQAGGGKQQITERDLQERNAEINRLRDANLAVAMGAVDTGEDFDPLEWMALNEAAKQAEIVALDGRLTALEGGGVVITYTVSGTWTNPTPTEHNLVTIVCVNGADGGSRGSTSIYDTAKGGQSGGYIQRSFYTDELPATVAMVIGAGGAGNDDVGGGPGGVGQITSFGSELVGIKGVGAIFKPDGGIPYETGIAPGNGGDGAFYSSAGILVPSTDGTGGPFAPGGRAGFGVVSAETNGKPGGAAPADIPSGGGGGGGGSVTTGVGTSGAGGDGGFPGGGGGGGARDGSIYLAGGDGAQGAIFEIRHW